VPSRVDRQGGATSRLHIIIFFERSDRCASRLAVGDRETGRTAPTAEAPLPAPIGEILPLAGVELAKDAPFSNIPCHF